MIMICHYNNFFAYWIKEIDIKRYGYELQILPRTNALKDISKDAKNAQKLWKILFFTTEKRLNDQLIKREDGKITIPM